MFIRADGTTTALRNIFHGQSAFLVCGGPSLASHDLDQLQRRGILTMAVNNAAAVVRPQLWTCVDDPANLRRDVARSGHLEIRALRII
jgi:hypothetical protein